jgi:hypothetical protein
VPKTAAPRPPLPTLVWGSFCQALFGCRTLFSSLSSLSVSLFDLRARFSVPTHVAGVTPRAGAVKDGPLGPPRSGSSLTAASTVSRCAWSEGDNRSPLARASAGTPVRSEGSLRSVGRTLLHNLVFGESAGFDHDAVMRIGGKAPWRRVQSTRAARRPGWASAHRHLGSSGRSTGTADGRRTCQRTPPRLVAGTVGIRQATFSLAPAGTSPVVT